MAFCATVSGPLAIGCWAPHAYAKVTVTHVTAGSWMSTDFHDPANPGCSIGINSSVPGSRLVMGANRRRSDPVTLLIKRDQWRITPGTALQAVAQFPNDRRIELTGTGEKQNFNIDLTGPTFAQWVRALKNNKIMQISFGGQEPTWVFDLEGAPAIINSMVDCLEGHQITQLPDGLLGRAVNSTGAELAPAVVVPAAPVPASSNTAAQVALSPAPSVGTSQGNTLPSGQSDQPVIVAWDGVQDMQTRPFHADGPWEMQWTSGDGHFSIVLHDANGGQDKLLVNTLTAGSSSYFMPRSGDFFAEISASSAWSAKAVPLKDPTTTRSTTVSSVPSPQTEAKAAVSDTRSVAPADTSQSTPVIPAASKEDAFVAAVAAARRQYADGQNDMAKGAARPSRKQALCQLMKADDVNGWSGKIQELTTNGDGKGVISIEIGPHAQLKTWNNSLSDALDNTMIDPQSSVFQDAVKLHKGQSVRFTAKLVPSDIDCFKEGSVTLEGSISDPEFIMHLVSIEGAP